MRNPCRSLRHPASALLILAVGGALGSGGTAAPPEAPTTRPQSIDPGPSPTLGAPAPSTGSRPIVRFDGEAWTGWRQRDGQSSAWIVQPDGSVLVHGGDAISEASFGDFQLHLEFRCPPLPDKTGQAKGNSGVYLHGRYEVQVLDTFGLSPADSGCGGIYSVAAPLVEASRPGGSWQTYDIIFRAPRLDDTGAVLEPARVTVLQNGTVIHNNLELPRATPGGLDQEIAATGPLLLQDHGDAVRYRNIWIRAL